MFRKGGLVAAPIKIPAALVLEDGTAYYGNACGARGESFGEICFNTSMVGYQEVISDPSYAGQILMMTYPQIGNYGVNTSDMQSDTLHLRGLVVRDMCYHPSNFRSEMSLPEFLERQGIIAIEGIDTRELTRHIRDCGSMRAVISTEDTDFESLLERVRTSPSLVGQNLAMTVSCDSPHMFTVESEMRPTLTGSAEKAALAGRATTVKHKVVAYDCGAKRSILLGLADAGCEVIVVPWDTSAEYVLSQEPDGVFISNGPGDPEPVVETIEEIKKLIGKVPLFGICLGHQIMTLAIGGKVVKLKYGHHGGNQPVMNLLSGCVEITAQNHGFNIDLTSIGSLAEGYTLEDTSDLRACAVSGVPPIFINDTYGRVRLTHVNLNDGTAEGLEFLDVPAFSEIG
ncbi:MAG: glutamine-hydrolyzing carbamoyl-phosphate synthase small subunit, partial [Actinobacteria bacterium]|nr:glutamine-hydrolyzing carbamoyl-phosphate synthase small subunit [Actinomycetota bacterium]